MEFISSSLTKDDCTRLLRMKRRSPSRRPHNDDDDAHNDGHGVDITANVPADFPDFGLSSHTPGSAEAPASPSNDNDSDADGDDAMLKQLPCIQLRHAGAQLQSLRVRLMVVFYDVSACPACAVQQLRAHIKLIC